MTITMGPILALEEATHITWNVTAVVVFKGEDPLKAQYGHTPLGADGTDTNADDLYRVALPELLEVRGNRTIVRYRFLIGRKANQEQTVHYQIGDARFDFRVPEASHPPRMGYGSCNGFADPATMRKVPVKNALWKAPKGAKHRGVLDAPPAERLHLLLMGGDQIYADQIWACVPNLQGFQDLDQDKQVKKKCNEATEKQIAKFYIELYEARWMQDDVRRAFATIPSIMMWDDHDIFDGWGSYDEDLLDSPIFTAIFRQAAHHFDMFQRHSMPGEKAESALGHNARTALYDLGGQVSILVLDMRTERRITRVMSDETWKNLGDCLRALGEEESPKHLLVMSSIPVVHPDMSWLEGPLGWFGSELEDDLRDHWNSHAHKGERLRLVHRLFALSDKGVRITFLSGDVHVGAAGAIEWTQINNAKPYANRIEQLTSSGIVHKGPPSMMVSYLEYLARKTQEFDADTRARMMKLPGSQNVFIGDRNWLALTVDDQHRIWACFHVEDQSQPLEKVIHAVGGAREELLDVAVAERATDRITAHHPTR